MVKCYQKDYPRPQFVRKLWQNLNGKWNFAFDDENAGEANGWYNHVEANYEIEVPFTYETKRSGIQDETVHNYVWYEKDLMLAKEQLGSDRLILHLEGCDYITKVWLNGVYLGSHEGAYARFSFDMTHAVKDGKNVLVIKAEDSLDNNQPRGKQRWLQNSYACWYVQTTGIWKTVWLEQVPEQRIESVKITPEVDTGTVSMDFSVNAPKLEDIEIEAEVTYEDRLVNRIRIPVVHKNVHTELDVYNTDIYVAGLMLWSPQQPRLYDVVFHLISKGRIVDTVGSYFGMRSIKIEKNNILLNGRPIYQRLLLDQGYWQDSHLTPPDEAALVGDIDKIIRLGYNGVRKHQKTEDERFLYWCDVKGLLVWSEMASTYHFNDDAVQKITTQWMEIVRQNYNHPSVIVWTPFNESWGIPAVRTDPSQQHLTESIYYLTKCFDKHRPVMSNDGWEHTVSDIITLHDYEADGEVFAARYQNHTEEILNSELFVANYHPAFAKGFEYRGQPIIISEFGGIAMDHDDSGWGYGGKVKGEEEFLKRFDKITTAIKELPYVCGYCYTQVTDVQQEKNGLMDMERNFKVDPDKVSEINTRVVHRFK